MEFTSKGILEIEGKFWVPDYQRGYRWGTTEVELLLNDIMENGEQPEQNYYLQPIVVNPYLQPWEPHQKKSRKYKLLIFK